MVLKAVLDLEHWSGHGEGGTLANIRIVGWKHDGWPYNSTDQDLARAQRIVDALNAVMKEESIDGT